jgi:hypothetical protein
VKKITLAACSLALLLLIYFFARYSVQYSYQFQNGTVYIAERNIIAHLLGKRDTYYWNNTADEKNSRTHGWPLFNGLVVGVGYDEKIPPSQNPFSWAPPTDKVRNKLRLHFADYDHVKVYSSALKLDANLKPGETENAAYLRLIDTLAERYCSYNQQKRTRGAPQTQP